MPEIEDTEVRAVLRAVSRWFEVAQAEGYFNVRNLYPDLVHSALLRRLLSGKEPLPEPPPVTMSYPNYALGEGKPYQPRWGVEFHSDGKSVMIDQRRWELVAAEGNRFIVVPGNSKSRTRYVLRPMTANESANIGGEIPDGQQWIVRRLDAL